MTNDLAAADGEAASDDGAGLLNSESEAEEELDPDDFSEEVCTASCSDT